MIALGYPLIAIISIIDGLLFAYSLIVLAAVIMTWVNADPYNPIVRAINGITWPLFNKVGKYMPKIGAIDLSPLAVLLAITFIQKGILPIFYSLGQQMLQ